MLKFPPLFVQKIFCFVQIPKSFVQKHETITAETEGNNSNVRKTSNNIQRKQQQCLENKQQHPEKTTAMSGENDSCIQEKHTQKSYGFCTKA